MAKETLTLSIPETGEHLGISPRSVWPLIKAGEIRSLKVGNRRRVLRSSVLDYLERGANAVQPTDPRIGLMLAAREAKKKERKTPRPRVVSRGAQ